MVEGRSSNDRIRARLNYQLSGWLVGRGSAGCQLFQGVNYISRKMRSMVYPSVSAWSEYYIAIVS